MLSIRGSGMAHRFYFTWKGFKDQHDSTAVQRLERRCWAKLPSVNECGLLEQHINITASAKQILVFWGHCFLPVESSSFYVGFSVLSHSGEGEFRIPTGLCFPLHMFKRKLWPPIANAHRLIHWTSCITTPLITLFYMFLHFMFRFNSAEYFASAICVEEEL